MNSLTLRATLMLASLLLLGNPLVARAQTSPAPAMSGDAMPSMADASCDKANAMMMMPMAHMAMPAGTDVDKTYSSMMAAHAKMMLDMAKLEMRCGKDKKAKDNAANASTDLQKLVQTLTLF